MPYINEDQFGQPYPQAGERLTRPDPEAQALRAENERLRVALREIVDACYRAMAARDESVPDVEFWIASDKLIAAARRARAVLEGEDHGETG